MEPEGASMRIRPLRNLMQVERLPDLGNVKNASGEVVTAGGIIVPADYKARGSVKAVNKPNFFRARVIAIGPQVRDVAPGDEVLVLGWAEQSDGTRRGMYTGIDVPDGTLLIEYPQDVECVLDREEAAE